jgi:hypothetical protein
MNFTFGIVTGGGNDKNITTIIETIEKQNIENYEIIIVGNTLINRKNVTCVPFNENIVPMWITRKKNIITYLAKYENIVYLHDYIMLCDDWYEGFIKYGNDFKVCMTKMINPDGTRYRDWTLWADDIEKIINSRGFLLPYDMTHLSKYMYISGAYWVAKKDIMMKYPLDENRIWGQAEDVEWSYRFKKDNDFSMNLFSTVRLLKQKDKAFDYSSEKDIEILKKLK